MRLPLALLPLLCLGLQAQPARAVLDTFRLEIQPAYLDSLVSTPEHGERYPGLVEWSADRCSCQVGLRGATSMACEKKSFQLELTEPAVPGISEILLNAEFRDTTMMRNCLGLRLSTMMGRPSPFARHAWLVINDQDYGIYLQVEEVDQNFLDRFALGCGPVFKSEGHAARMAMFSCDHDPLDHFEARMDCGHMSYTLEELIQRINLGSHMPVDTLNFLDYAVTSIAMRDTDAITKNFFTVRKPDGSWSFVPWDRDATFGNSWRGNWEPWGLQRVFLNSLARSPLLQRFLETPEGAAMAADRLELAADLMEWELMPAADSVYQVIRPYVLADPWLQISPESYDAFCDSLFMFLEARPAILRAAAGDMLFSPVESLSVYPCRIQDESAFSVWLESRDPLRSSELNMFTRQNNWAGADMVSQNPGDTLWSVQMEFPDSVYAYAISCYTNSALSGDNSCLGTYPIYGFANYFWSPTAHPSVVRALAPLDPNALEPLQPLRLGPTLWTLPVANLSDEEQDLSRCGFLLPGSGAAVYMPDSFLMAAGDTLLLTNDRESLALERPTAPVVGNLQALTPAGDRLTFLDPGWTPRWQRAVEREDTLPVPQPSLVITEVCATPAAASDDWLEIYNRSGAARDLTGSMLVDCQGRSSPLPDGTVVAPWGFLVLCRDQEDFLGEFGSIPGQLACCLQSGLRDDRDSVCLVGRTGRSLANLAWDSGQGWPCGGDSVMALTADSPAYRLPQLWRRERLPGSPGEANPSWTTGTDLPLLRPITPCPARLAEASRIQAEYAVDYLPAQLRIYSLDGRLVTEPITLGQYQGIASVELEEIQSPGVYLFSLVCRGERETRKLVVIP